MPLSVGKLERGELAEASSGKVDLEQITLGQDIIWEKPDPYVPGTMVLVIETTKENQVVNLGYTIGRWQNTDKAAKKYPTKGTVTWEEDSEPVAFNGNEGISEDNNPLVHTYETVGEHKITIKGVVKWNKVSTSNSNTSTPNSIRETLKSIEIPEGETSPIYYIDTYAFYYCKNLESILGNLFENCTEVTDFSRCFYSTPITKIPEGLFDSCTQATNFYACFYSTPITKIPEGLFDSCTQATNFGACFLSTQITAIPQGLFDSCTQATNFTSCFQRAQITAIPQELFDQCTQATNFGSCFMSTQITTIPQGLFDSCAKATSFKSCFQSTKITAIPQELFAKCTQAKDFERCFRSTQITAIPQGLFDSCTQAKNFRYCFHSTQITAIPQNLFANNNAVTDFSYTFSSCSKVEGSLPELWESHPDVTNHTKCFYNCTQATNYQEAQQAGWA